MTKWQRLRHVAAEAWLDLRVALLQFTRFPVPAGEMPSPGRARRGAWAWPVAGLLAGAAGALAYWLAGSLGLPPLLAALLAVAAMVLATGALHEDGLADFADGIGGGRDRESRLRIMRDSRLGSYGALALVLATLWRIAALAALPPALAIPAILALAAAARWSSALLAHALPPANPDGQSAAAGRPGLPALAAGLAACLLPALLLPGALPVLPLLAALAAAAITGLLVRRAIGGQTGDALGTAAQGCEILGYGLILSLLP